MENKESFYSQYLCIVKTLDALSEEPYRVNNEIKSLIDGIYRFVRCFISSMVKLQNYPSLEHSLFSLLERDDMGGYLGEFVIKKCIDRCETFEQKREKILLEVDRLSVLSVRVNGLDDIKDKVDAWQRFVSIYNIEYVDQYLESLYIQVKEMADSCSGEMWSRAYAQSEKERQRLEASEEARRKEIIEQEQNDEEKYRRACEEFMYSIKTRKKK